MDALDGNAIGGLLIDVFGTEMTAANSTCRICGASRPVAELVVYQRAPGTVVRCRTCGSVLMIFVKAHGVTCVDLDGLASLGQSETGLTRAGRDVEMALMANEHPGNPTEGANMSHEEPMSVGTPDEEPMSKGGQDEGPMSMGTPDEGSMGMQGD